MKKLGFLMVVSFIFTCVFLGYGVAQTQKLPPVISMTSYEPGSTSYATAMGFAEGIRKVTGMKITLEAYGTDAGRMVPVRDKKTEVMWISSGAIWLATNGLDFFSKPEWGDPSAYGQYSPAV